MLSKAIWPLFALVVASNAAAYSVNNANGWNTTGLTGFSTTGAMMDGMTVSAIFVDGTKQTAIWADDPSSENGGKASGTDFIFRESGDTFSNRWTLTSTASLKPIRSLIVDAGTGNTVFDIVYAMGMDFGSPGSMNGYFDITLIKAGVVADVVFSGPVSVNHVFYGDLYRTMTINFTNPEGYFGFNFFRIQADTDNLRIAGDIVPDNGVPEPTVIALLGAGLLGLAFGRRRRM